jgi:hypothetical protein
MGAGTWYSLRIDIADDESGWRPYTAPWTQVHDQPVAEIAAQEARDHDLAGLSWPWRVRIYDGYNQFKTLLCEITGGPETD